MVKLAHPQGISVEGELGCPRARSKAAWARRKTATGPKGVLDHSQLLTDPAQAEDFVRQTKVDALAVAIGTSHGAYKFTRKPDGDVLAMDRIIEIHKRLPNCHMVMHGSSSVPQDLQDIINKYGGKMKQTWGVPVEEIQLGIKNGVRKINVDTDNRMAMTGGDPQGAGREPGKVRPARLPEAGPRRDEGGLQGPDGVVRPGGAGEQDQAGDDEGVREGVRLRAPCQSRARSEALRAE